MHRATEAVWQVNPQLVPVAKRMVYVDNYYDGGEVTNEVVSPEETLPLQVRTIDIRRCQICQYSLVLIFETFPMIKRFFFY